MAEVSEKNIPYRNVIERDANLNKRRNKKININVVGDRR